MIAATKTPARELERLETERDELMNMFGQSPFRDGIVRDRIARLDADIAHAAGVGITGTAKPTVRVDWRSIPITAGMLVEALTQDRCCPGHYIRNLAEAKAREAEAIFKATGAV